MLISYRWTGALMCGNQGITPFSALREVKKTAWEVKLRKITMI